ncbi:MAG TPA: pyrimidine reductase family protein [Acidimicrobiales bacterium]|nr:pyrimidine reductase family protein [Acidimicrobiales bacterium]
MLWPTGRGAGAGRGRNPVDGGDVEGSDQVDPADVYGADPRPPVGDRPWVLCNMIASVDGAATDAAGRSGGLGGPADLRVFSAIRAVADIVLAGAGTVRTERYGPARPSPAQEEARRARGQSPRPRIAVVTRSLALDLELPLFREATDEHRPIVITTTGSLDASTGTAATATQELAMVAEIIIAGDDAVDWDTALRALRTTARAGVVLVEGGPSTNGQLLADDLVDELCLTVSPQIVATAAPRIVNSVVEAPRRMTLDRVLVEDDYLFVRYLRARHQP